MGERPHFSSDEEFIFAIHGAMFLPPPRGLEEAKRYVDAYVESILAMAREEARAAEQRAWCFFQDLLTFKNPFGKR